MNLIKPPCKAHLTGSEFYDVDGHEICPVCGTVLRHNAIEPIRRFAFGGLAGLLYKLFLSRQR